MSLKALRKMLDDLLPAKEKEKITKQIKLILDEICIQRTGKPGIKLTKKVESNLENKGRSIEFEEDLSYISKLLDDLEDKLAPDENAEMQLEEIKKLLKDVHAIYQHRKEQTRNYKNLLKAESLLVQYKTPIELDVMKMNQRSLQGSC